MDSETRHRQSSLSRRERQIMDVLYQRREATAEEVREAMPDAPSNSAVRAHLRTLEEKGHVRRQARELRYVYMPTVRPGAARRHAVRHLIDTFFGGSAEKLMAALLDSGSLKLRQDELERLSAMIEKAKQEGE
jgi:predicted transcriptional regulator